SGAFQRPARQATAWPVYVPGECARSRGAQVRLLARAHRYGPLIQLGEMRCARYLCPSENSFWKSSSEAARGNREFFAPRTPVRVRLLAPFGAFCGTAGGGFLSQRRKDAKQNAGKSVRLGRVARLFIGGYAALS